MKNYDNINFDEVYKKVCDKYSEQINEAEAFRKKKLTKYICISILLVIVAILLAFLGAELFFDSDFLLNMTVLSTASIFMGVVPVAIVIYIVLDKKTPEKLDINKIYKNNVLNDIVSSLEPGVNLSDMSSVTKTMYEEAKFTPITSNYRMKSEDMIHGNMENGSKIIISEVHLYHTTRDSDGDQKDVTDFFGIFSVIEMSKKVEKDIYIRSDKIDLSLLGKLFADEDRVKTDSEEFEKQFDVYSEDSILAMRFLTSDIMEELIKLKRKLGRDFEISLRGNKIYYRFSRKDLFEPKYQKNLSRENILNVYNIFKEFFYVANRMAEIVEDVAE